MPSEPELVIIYGEESFPSDAVCSACGEHMPWPEEGFRHRSTRSSYSWDSSRSIYCTRIRIARPPERKTYLIGFFGGKSSPAQFLNDFAGDKSSPCDKIGRGSTPLTLAWSQPHLKPSESRIGAYNLPSTDQNGDTHPRSSEGRASPRLRAAVAGCAPRTFRDMRRVRE
jgi:hypothetical protein